MKRLIAVAVLALAFVAQAQAARLYEVMFRPDSTNDCPCWGGATVCDAGGCYNIVANGVNTYVIVPSASLTITVNVWCACPSAGGTLGDKELGHTWTQYTDDAGLHWTLVLGSYTTVKMPSGTTGGLWFVQSDLSGGHLSYVTWLAMCPGM